MIPSARSMAVIEILDTIRDKQEIPADRVVSNYFRFRKYIGSKDRGEIAESVYSIIRNQALLEYLCESFRLKKSSRTVLLCYYANLKDTKIDDIYERFSGEKYSPETLSKQEIEAVKECLKSSNAVRSKAPHHVKFSYPEWILSFAENKDEKLEIEKQMQAMQLQAPMDLRVNTLLIDRDSAINLLESEGIHCEKTPISSVGIRITKRSPIFATDAYKNGLVEVQDEGSQIAGLLIGAQKHHKVIDFCAGAGGKSLILSNMMEGKGKILSFDVIPSRLEELRRRATRAKADNITIKSIESESDKHLKRYYEFADIVVADVPCSGSGTWRRNPDMKWKLTSSDIERYNKLQFSILSNAAKLVKPEGYIVYITCSIFRAENQSIIEKFLAGNNNFAISPFLGEKNITANQSVIKNQDGSVSLNPAQTNTDGFFICCLRKL